MTIQHREVVIAGAGLGGLALAHGLLQEGVDVVVLKKDRSRSHGMAGLRLDVAADGSWALQNLLPADLYELFLYTAGESVTGMFFFDERLRVLLALGDEQGLRLRRRGPIEGLKPVSRLTLRQVLLTGLEEVVRYDSSFESYGVQPDGKVLVKFQGGRILADVLVGADGTNSQVRRQLLPDARLEDTGPVAILGKVPLANPELAAVPDAIRGQVALVLARIGRRAVFHTMRFPRRRAWLRAGPQALSRPERLPHVGVPARPAEPRLRSLRGCRRASDRPRPRQQRRLA